MKGYSIFPKAPLRWALPSDGSISCPGHLLEKLNEIVNTNNGHNSLTSWDKITLEWLICFYMGVFHSSWIRWTLLWGRVICWQSLMAVVTRSRLSDVGVEEAQHSCHVTNPPQTSESCLPQALTLLGGARFITWHLKHLVLEECWWVPRHFWSCRACLGFRPVPGPALKKALCQTPPFGVAHDK